MSDEYVQWDVHASTDEPTPRMEYDDPLSRYNIETEVCIDPFI